MDLEWYINNILKFVFIIIFKIIIPIYYLELDYQFFLPILSILINIRIMAYALRKNNAILISLRYKIIYEIKFLNKLFLYIKLGTNSINKAIEHIINDNKYLLPL